MHSNEYSRLKMQKFAKLHVGLLEGANYFWLLCVRGEKTKSFARLLEVLQYEQHYFDES